jgi:O-methyltransferase involved in polyketide biosynthesis
VAGCAAGSEIVFSYGPTPDHLDDIGRRFSATFEPIAAQSGEPVITRLDRPDVEALVERSGLQVADHPDHEEWCERYFAGRSDGLRPYTVEAMLTAAVTA